MITDLKALDDDEEHEAVSILWSNHEARMTETYCNNQKD